MNDQQLHAYCLEWIKWCETRRYYLKPGAQNILARMQPSKSGSEPDARNDPDMQHFHHAIHAMADMPERQDELICFNKFYIAQVPDIKREAYELGISRQTYYNRSRAFARKAYSLAQSLKRVHDQRIAATEEMVQD